MSFSIFFVDFWEGHDPDNNILTNTLRNYINPSISIADSASSADIIFVTIYGSLHLDIIRDYRSKCILWLGENVRPSLYGCPFSISFDYHTYNKTNFRLPLWFSEIDWFGTNLGVIHVNDVFDKLVSYGNMSPSDLVDSKFCITIFNNPEGERLHLYDLLNSFQSVTGFGRPFGNWFPTFEHYKSKIKHMGNYRFNLCPENSYHPGYYTEKCFHAKVSQTCPIYKCDSHVITDFRPSSFLNLYTFRNSENMLDRIKFLDSNRDKLVDIINEPLLHQTPSLDHLIDFLKFSTSRILCFKS